MSHTADDPPRHRYTVADYQRMGEAGILAPDARVELIDGEIIDMPPIGFRHSGTVDRLTRTLVTAFGDRAIVLIDLEAATLERHRRPLTARYTLADRPALGEPLAIEALPSVELDLRGLFET